MEMSEEINSMVQKAKGRIQDEEHTRQVPVMLPITLGGEELQLLTEACARHKMRCVHVTYWGGDTMATLEMES